jgi:hypothetical protein
MTFRSTSFAYEPATLQYLSSTEARRTFTWTNGSEAAGEINHHAITGCSYLGRVGAGRRGALPDGNVHKLRARAQGCGSCFTETNFRVLSSRLWRNHTTSHLGRDNPISASSSKTR